MAQKQLALLSLLTASSILMVTHPISYAQTQVVPSSHNFVSLSAAVTINPFKNTTTLEPTDPNLPTTYFNTNGGDEAFADFGISAGRYLTLNPKWALRLGAAFYTNKAQQKKGVFYVLPSKSNEYSYLYKINSHRLMLQTRLYYQASQTFALFYGFAFGLGQIHTSALSFTPAAGSQAAATPYPDQGAVTQNHAMGSVTLGTRMTFTQHTAFELSLKQLWMGNNQIAVFDGTKKHIINDGMMRPWQIGFAINYHF